MAIKVQGITVIDDDRNASFDGTGSLRVPSGTTAERPASPVAGELRFNTDLNVFEQYDGVEWGSVGAGDADLTSVSIDGTPVINNARELKNITNADNIIKKPTNESPANGTTDIGGSSQSVTLTASAYNDLFGGQASATFQVSDSSDFSNLVVDETISGSSVDSYTISDVGSVLTESTQYYWRVKYTDTNSNESLFSDSTTFTTASTFVSVDQPTITSPSDGAVDIGEDPTITTSSFSVTGTTDTHQSTDWQIASDSSFNTIVVQSLNDTSNLVSWTVPKGNLSENTTYYVRARHTGTNLGDSVYSNTVSFTTASSFFPSYPGGIGEPAEGGYFAGRINDGGTIFNLIVAPKSTGENSSVAWGTGASDGQNTGADSDIDGPTNTSILVNNYSSGDTEAAHFCDGLSIGGYNDWYMPAKNELEVCYYWLKPTTDSNDTSDGSNPNAVSPEPINTDYSINDPAQTSVTIFQSGNAEAFGAGVYWASSEYSSNYAWIQVFGNGFQNYNGKDDSFRVRAVRRVAV